MSMMGSEEARDIVHLNHRVTILEGQVEALEKVIQRLEQGATRYGGPAKYVSKAVAGPATELNPQPVWPFDITTKPLYDNRPDLDGSN